MRRSFVTAARPRRRLAYAAAAFLALAACADREGQSDPQVTRGRAVYLSNCTACHGADPALEGAIGPPVAGASLELLEARLLRGEYPPGYTPKLNSGAMPRFPQLEADLPALHAFLGDAARRSAR